MNILVTGGSGFIGCNLIASLLQIKNNKVICFDNLCDNSLREQKLFNINLFLANKNFLFIEGDICITLDLERIPQVDVIIHLAAKTGVRSSIEYASSYYEVNVNGTFNLLEFAKKRRIEQFVFASSSSIYGVNSNITWCEDDQPMPISPYAYTKLECERMGLFYTTQNKLRFIGLRFFNVFGPFQRHDLVVYKFFHDILLGRPLTVFGDGSSRRDYSDVTDIVQGIISALNYKRSNYEIINLSGGYNLTLNKLIYLIEQICDKKAVINYKIKHPLDVMYTHGSIVKAQMLLGYFPQNNLESALKKFHKWFLSDSNAFNTFSLNEREFL